MDPDHKAAQSAGYRNVALNLRMVNVEAQKLGIETHIAEVQLLLKSFAELKVNVQPLICTFSFERHRNCSFILVV